jgi:cell division protein FtsL
METEGPPIVLVPEFQPERKHFRLRKWHVVAIVLVVIICVQAFLYVSLLARYNSLDTAQKSLLSEHVALEADYDSLQLDHSALQSSYQGLQASHSSLQTDYDSLQSDYDSLDASYDSLQSSYGSLQTSYNTLQSSFDSYYSDYANLRDLINQRSQYLDIMDFVTPNDSDVSSIVFSVTGGWSNPSNWNEYWSDVKAMYDWVVNNVDYRSDGLFPVLPSTPSGSVEYEMEMWQFPNETLYLRQGDCEDMAILLTSMIRSYNDGAYSVECIWITGSMGAHAAVQFPMTGDELTILDPAGHYYTQDGYGNLDSKGISTEINNWLNYWRSSLGSDVRVYRVFSSYMDRIFSSTSEYTTWMYNR